MERSIVIDAEWCLQHVIRLECGWGKVGVLADGIGSSRTTPIASAESLLALWIPSRRSDQTTQSPVEMQACRLGPPMLY